MPMKSSQKLAFGGILTALSVVVMLLSFFSIADYALPAIAGVLLIPAVIEMGSSRALGVYAATAVLSFFLAPSKEAAVMYIAFPDFKGRDRTAWKAVAGMAHQAHGVQCSLFVGLLRGHQRARYPGGHPGGVRRLRASGSAFACKRHLRHLRHRRHPADRPLRPPDAKDGAQIVSWNITKPKTNTVFRSYLAGKTRETVFFTLESALSQRSLHMRFFFIRPPEGHVKRAVPKRQRSLSREILLSHNRTASALCFTKGRGAAPSL